MLTFNAIWIYLACSVCVFVFEWKPQKSMFILLEKQNWTELFFSLSLLIPFPLPLVSFLYFCLTVFTFVCPAFCVFCKQVSIFMSCQVISFLESHLKCVTVPCTHSRWRNWASQMLLNLMTRSPGLIAQGLPLSRLTFSGLFPTYFQSECESSALF